MSNTSPTTTGGISFLGLLTIVFITLKLTNTIDWSWWWVLAPILWPIYIVIFCLIMAGIVALLKK